MEDTRNDKNVKDMECDEVCAVGDTWSLLDGAKIPLYSGVVATVGPQEVCLDSPSSKLKGQREVCFTGQQMIPKL